MGGDRITGLGMADYARLFERDPDTDAIVVFGEPGTRNERDLADALRRQRVTKPVIALIAGAFQEGYPAGQTFGHAAALVREPADSATAKMALLRDAGASIAQTLDEIPALIAKQLGKFHATQHS
jgi:succinyl-CoA synthetase alpha subunit